MQLQCREEDSASDGISSDRISQPCKLKTTWYFDVIVRQKRPEIDPDWCVDVLNSPVKVKRQPNGRYRFWGEITLTGETVTRVLRVITLEDGETILNASFDRRFQREKP